MRVQKGLVSGRFRFLSGRWTPKSDFNFPRGRQKQDFRAFNTRPTCRGWFEMKFWGVETEMLVWECGKASAAVKVGSGRTSRKFTVPIERTNNGVEKTTPDRNRLCFDDSAPCKGLEGLRPWPSNRRAMEEAEGKRGMFSIYIYISMTINIYIYI